MVRLEQADAADFLKSLPDGEVSLLATDPPYFRVKNEPWDRQWDTADGFLDWLDGILAEVERVLAPNGSLYLFASPRMAARVEVLIGGRFNVLNRIRWLKEAGWHKKTRSSDLRSYLSPWEEIIFAEPHSASDSWTHASDGVRASVFEPLRAYLDGERQRAGVSKEDLNREMGFAPRGMAEARYFSRSQWQLPTAEHYENMRQALHDLNGGGEYLRREYEDLRREYEDLRREYEDLRRPFTVTPDDQYTDVWTFPTVQTYPGKHPCEKPAPLMEQIVRASTRPGDLVVDPFMGSGSTGVAAVKLGRRFAGCDLSADWVQRGAQRINAETLALF